MKRFTGSLAEATKAWIGRARQAVFLIPWISLLGGTAMSLYIFQYFQQREFEVEWRSAYEKARESVSQIDLLLANSLLRLHSYEDNFGSRSFNYQDNTVLLRQLLQQTIFQRMYVYQDLRRRGADTRNLRLKFRISTPASQLPNEWSDRIPGAELEPIVKDMELSSDYMETFVYEKTGVPRLSIINRSKFDPYTVSVFSTPLIALFQKTDLRAGDSVLLSTKSSDQSWRVLVDRNGNKAISRVAQGSLSATSGGDVYFDRGLPQSKVDVGLQFSFSPSSRQVLSSSKIAGGMSFLLTLIVSYLFHVLITQNRNAKRMILNKTLDLEKTAHDLQEVLNEKARFLGKVSHEIRTPLNLILGMIGLCEEADSQRTLAHYLRPMKSSGEHLLSMIDDLIDLAKAEASDLGFQGKRLYLAPFLGEVARLAEQDCRKKGLKLFCYLDPDLPAVVMCDPSRLRQVLLNLLRNACKYTYRGHVILNAIAVQGAGDATALVRFEIQDTGVGIPADKIEKIFDAFFQVEGSVELSEGGVGLGLSIVKDIVQKMNGRVRVRAAPEGGSIFEVDLELESPGDVSWLHAHSAPDDRLRTVYVVSGDPCFQRCFWSLSRHRNIKVVPLESSGLSRRADFPAVDLSCVVIDSNASELRLNELRRYAPPQGILLFGDGKALAAKLTRMEGVTVIDGPPSALEVLSRLGFALRGRVRGAQHTNGYFEEPFDRSRIHQKNLSLIVADDDLGNLELYRAYFSATNWSVEYVLDGLEAWEEYRHFRPDLMVLDLRMPGLDGAQVIEKIREFERHENLKSIPIILVTADVMQDAVRLPLSYKNVSVLTKPVKKQQLLEAIQALASQRRRDSPETEAMP